MRRKDGSIYERLLSWKQSTRECCPKREEQRAKGDAIARILACERVNEPVKLSSASKLTKDTRVESRVRYGTLKSDGTKFMGELNYGADITVIRQRMLPKSSVQHAGIITLEGAFGRSVMADLVYVALELPTEQADWVPYLKSLCAVTAELTERIGAVLTPQGYAEPTSV